MSALDGHPLLLNGNGQATATPFADSFVIHEPHPLTVGYWEGHDGEDGDGDDGDGDRYDGDDGASCDGDVECKKMMTTASSDKGGDGGGE